VANQYWLSQQWAAIESVIRDEGSRRQTGSQSIEADIRGKSATERKIPHQA